MAATDFVLAGMLAIGATQAAAIPDPQASAPSTIAERDRIEVFDREYAIRGTTAGAGIVVPIGARLGMQLAYDRHTRSRDFEFGGGFFGTEQLVTAKALFFFRPAAAVRPYAAIGLGMIESSRRSEFPTITSSSSRAVAGPPEILRYHTRDAALGFGAGFDAKVARQLALLGDLTLDLGAGETLGSTRLTFGVASASKKFKCSRVQEFCSRVHWSEGSSVRPLN